MIRYCANCYDVGEIHEVEKITDEDKGKLVCDPENYIDREELLIVLNEEITVLKEEREENKRDHLKFMSVIGEEIAEIEKQKRELR